MQDAKRINTAPPEIIDYDENDIFADVARPGLLSVTSSTEEMEDVMIRTYMSVMRDTNNKDRIKAADSVGEILGHRGKKSVTIVNADNAQINQNQTLPLAMQKHLLSARDGIETLTSAVDANISIQPGGQGA